MVEGKTLSTFRDIVIIVGMLFLCFVGMQEITARMQARREQAARFAMARNAITKLDDAYKQLIANKTLNEQFFRQNEILLEYQKVILTLAYMPAPVVTTAPGPAAPSTSAPATPPAATPPEKR
jgi:arginine exporter protein ArgO